MEPIIVVPYVNEDEIQQLKAALGFKLPVFFWKDVGRIGSSLRYDEVSEMRWQSICGQSILAKITRRIVLHLMRKALDDQ